MGAVGEQPEQSSQSSAVLADRRAVTVMFCDLVGSTAMSEVLDPEDLLEVVAAYQSLCREKIEQEDGHLAKYLGDGVLAFFGYPTANDDDVRRSVRAGLAIVRSMYKLNRDFGNRVQLKTRIGIHTGHVVAGLLEPGTAEYSVVGTTPNLAARLQDQAEPDSVLVSADSHQLCAGYFQWSDVGELELKGIAAPMRAFRPLGESNIRTPFDLAIQRGLRQLVGRASEIDRLRTAFEAAAEGHGRVVTLTGEAGIGKSRLLYALRDDEAGKDVRWLTGRCSAKTSNTAFHPVLEVAHDLLGLAAGDAPDAQVTKIRQIVEAPEDRAVVMSMLSIAPDESDLPMLLSAERLRRRSMETLVDLLIAESRRSTVVVTIEDIHWVDPSTLEFLALLRSAIVDQRVLVVLSSRPPAIVVDGDDVTEISLGRLDDEGARELIALVSGGQTLSNETLALITERSDGVPLFVEEVTKMILESSDAEISAYHARGTTSVPWSLESSLQTRLDRLEEAKPVVQLASAIGREFDWSIIDGLGVFETDLLGRSLDSLVDAELLNQIGSPPDAHYTFRHALIQDAAYKSLLKGPRTDYNIRIAEFVESGRWGSAAARPEFVAHHYSEAAMPVRAIPEWVKAGQDALDKSANSEAIAYFTRALSEVASLSDDEQRWRTELAIVMGLGPAYTAAKGYGSEEAAQAHARALELCDLLGDPPERFWVLWGLGAFYQARGQHRDALETGRGCALLSNGRAELLADADFGVGSSLFYLGDIVGARDELEKVATYFLAKTDGQAVSPTGHHAGVIALGYLAQASWQLGLVQQAEERLAQSIELADSVGYPFIRMHSLHWATFMTVMARDRVRTRAFAEAEVALATEFGFPFGQLGGGITLAWLDVTDGNADGLEMFRALLGLYRGIGVRAGVTYFLAMLADACLAVGRIDEGLEAIADAFTEMNETGETAWEPELYRVRAALTAATDPASAKRDLETAIAISRDREAKMFEFLAATSLADFSEGLPQPTEALERLEELRQFITEFGLPAEQVDAV